MEFASWISPDFKLFIIREFKRLNIEWNLRRELAKAHYPMLKEAIINQLPEGINVSSNWFQRISNFL